MRNKFILLAVILCTTFSGYAQYVPVPVGLSANLNGIWKFSPSPDSKVFESASYNVSWKDIEVPGEWTMQGFTVAPGKRAAYQTRCNIPAEWSGKRIMLRFDAVYSDAVVWVNGKNAIRHIGGFNAFECDITDLLKKGQNLLTVGVMNESLADTLSCGSQYAAHPLGGILRKVTIFAVPYLFVSDVIITTDLDDKYENVKLGIVISLENKGKSSSDAEILIDLLSPQGESIAQKIFKTTLTGGSEKIENQILDITDPLKWTAESPTLYKLRLQIKSLSGSEIIERKIGFRELEVAGNQLFLNGTAIKLHGVNRHEVHPVRGRSLNMELWRKDALLYKSANINYIRTSHYPPAEEFIELCDSIGLYVELENALVWIGHNANLKLELQEARNMRILPELIKTATETILFYRNHPGIIIWSMANESGWSDLWAEVKKTADRIDNTRPKTFHDQAYGQYNNYGSSSMSIANIHYPGPKGPGIAASFERPLLFGEYCHLNTYNRQENATDPGVRDAWIRGFYPMWENMYKSKGCLGGAIWSGIDDAFMLPEGKLVGYGEWGPIDGWRRVKPEYYHIKKTYSPVIIGNRKATLNKNGEILLQVENRFDFTDLKDCRFEWEIGGLKGVSSVNLAPHMSGILRIGKVNSGADGHMLRVKIYSPYNLLIDESEIEIGTVSHHNFPFKTAVSDTPGIKENGNLIEISGKDVRWVFDRNKGKLMMASYRGDTILSSGAELMLLPLHSEECKTEHSLNIPFINNICSEWKVNSVVAARRNDTINISVKGSYKEAAIALEYVFAGNGIMIVRYNLTASQAVDPRQIGLVFSVPMSNSELSWYRKGFWSSYPDWHIGRINGKATPFPAETFYSGKLGVEPKTGWQYDANSLGTNDFRSTKDNIYWAALTKKGGSGILAMSDGRHSFRSYVEGGHVNFLVADYSNGGAEIFFASHLENERKPLKQGDIFSGEVTLKIVTSD
jgi:beta-galactosidase